MSEPNYLASAVVKAIMIGDAGVGKSSLAHRFCDKEWNPHFVSTVGSDFKEVRIHREDGRIALQLWDTAGQEKYRTLIPAYYRGADAAIIVFDVTSVSSFEGVTSWVNDLRKHNGYSDPTVVLVACKVDLERAVPYAAGLELATSLQCKYFETSSQDGSAVDDVFHYVVDACLAKRGATGLSQRELSKKSVNLRDDNFYYQRSTGLCMCGDFRQGMK